MSKIKKGLDLLNLSSLNQKILKKREMKKIIGGSGCACYCDPSTMNIDVYVVIDYYFS
jgi:natural product precursor